MRICERCDGDGLEPNTGEVIHVFDGAVAHTALCRRCEGHGIILIPCRACGNLGRGALCSRECFLGVFGEWRTGDPPPRRYDADGDPIEELTVLGTFRTEDEQRTAAGFRQLATRVTAHGGTGVTMRLHGMGPNGETIELPNAVFTNARPMGDMLRDGEVSVTVTFDQPKIRETEPPQPAPPSRPASDESE